ncbi:MAG: MFS transporter [Thermoleophilaceae bacterium]
MAGAVVALEAALYVALAPQLPGYVSRFSLDNTALALVVAAYPIATIAGTAIAAVAGRWVRPKEATIAGLVGLAAGTLGLAEASDAVSLCVARAGQGVGGGVAWVAVLAWAASEERDDARRGGLIGRLLALGVLGGVLGPALGVLAVDLGAATVFRIVAGALLCVAAGLAALPRSPVRSRERRQLTPKRPLLEAAYPLLPAALVTGALSVLAPAQFDRLGLPPRLAGYALAAAALLEAGWMMHLSRRIDRAAVARPRGRVLWALTALPLALALTQTRASSIVVVLASGPLCAGVAVRSAAALSNTADRLGAGPFAAPSLVGALWAAGFVAGAGGAALGSTGAAAAAVVAGALVAVTARAVRCYRATAAAVPTQPRFATR